MAERTVEFHLRAAAGYDLETVERIIKILEGRETEMTMTLVPGSMNEEYAQKLDAAAAEAETAGDFSHARSLREEAREIRRRLREGKYGIFSRPLGSI